MSKKPILLVEDNEDDVLLTQRAFKKNNLSNPIVVVRDGVEALDYLLGTGPNAAREEFGMPGLVLLDLKLPRLDGIEVLRRLRDDATHQTIPIVILTSSLEERDLIVSYELGANSYIRKPVEFNEFVTAVGQLGTYWLMLNEMPTEERS